MPKLEHHWAQQRWRDFKCKCCGVAFKSSRIDAEFCNSTCRQRDRRIRLAAAQAAEVHPKTGGMLVPTRSDLKLPRTRDKKLVKRLKKLDKLIDTALQTPTRSTTRKKGAKKK